MSVQYAGISTKFGDRNSSTGDWVVWLHWTNVALVAQRELLVLTADGLNIEKTSIEAKRIELVITPMQGGTTSMSACADRMTYITWTDASRAVKWER
jgi:hypothetical protein